MPSRKKKPENADAPYDSYEVVFADGTYYAMFYIAEERKAGRWKWPSLPLEVLERRQRKFRSEGRVTPVLDKALIEIHGRLAMETGLPPRTLQ